MGDVLEKLLRVQPALDQDIVTGLQIHRLDYRPGASGNRVPWDHDITKGRAGHETDNGFGTEESSHPGPAFLLVEQGKPYLVGDNPCGRE
jgi:hypothetical protein